VRKVIVVEYMSLDGVIQAPTSAPVRDGGPTGTLRLVDATTTPSGLGLLTYERAGPLSEASVP